MSRSTLQHTILADKTSCCHASLTLKSVLSTATCHARRGDLENPTSRTMGRAELQMLWRDLEGRNNKECQALASLLMMFPI